MGESGIYKIKNLINNKIYIGSAVDFSGRWRAHKSNLNISNGQISGVCKGKNNTAGGFIWKYKK